MRALVGSMGLLLLVAGCTSDPAPPGAPAVHKPAPRAADRDEKAVLGTLVNLDPCLLLGDADARRRRPHLCIADLPGYASVHVAINDRSSHAGRFTGGRKTIGGATVDGISAATSSLCQAEVPVSFRYAITINLLPAPDGHGCKAGDTDEYAAKVVANLGKLSQVRHPANRPDLSKDACTVLSNAATDAGTKLGPDQFGNRTVIDDCGASSLYGGGTTNFGMLIEPGPPQGGWGKKWATVAGKPIYYVNDGDCRWTWSEGTYSGDDNRLMTLSINKCKGTKAQMTDFLGAMVKELGAPQVPGTVERLTYRPGEADEPNPGACVDYQQDECEPYQPTPLPADVSAGAIRDGHVLCTATLDAVNARFPGMQAVVDKAGCSYVRPDHTVELDFRIWGSPSAPTAPPGSRKTTVAGHPAVSGEIPDQNQATVCVDTGKQSANTSENYDWCVTASFRAPRNTSGKPDAGGKAALEPLMAEVAEHF